MSIPFPGPGIAPVIHLATTEAQLRDTLTVFQAAEVLGYDHEWRPNAHGEDNPVAVIQLATATDILVLQLTAFEG